jgi:hypothetical protein
MTFLIIDGDNLKPYFFFFDKNLKPYFNREFFIIENNLKPYFKYYFMPLKLLGGSDPTLDT